MDEKGRNSTEKERETRRDMLLQFSEAGGGLAWETSRDMVLSYVSPSVGEVLGYEPGEMLGRSILDFVPPDEAERVAAAFAAVTVEGRPRAGIAGARIARDGRRLAVESYVAAVLDEAGGVAGFWGVDRPAAGTARGDARLLETGEGFREIFDAAPMGLGVLDGEGTVLEANAALLEMLAAPREEVVGSSARKWLPPGAFEEIAASEEARYGTGRPWRSFETALVNARGENVAVMANTVVIGREPLLVAVAVADISRRKRTEEALRESERKFRALAEVALEGICVHEKGTVLDCNPAFAAMLGYGREEIVGADALRFIAPADRERVEGYIREGYELPYEVELVRRDGSTLPAHVRAREIEYEGRRVRVAAVRDIEEFKLREERMLRQGALLAGINRVLREALTARSDREVARACVEVASEILRSELCFYGELNERGRFDTLAYSESTLRLCGMDEDRVWELATDMELRGVWALPLLEGKSMIVDRPSSHPASVGTPPGHPPISSYLGVPLRHGEEVIGLFSLARREGTYDPSDLEDLEALSSTFVEALYSKRAELELEEHRRRLEQMVEERTMELRLIQERLSAFMQAAPFSFYLLDRDLRVVEANRCGLDMVAPGTRLEELVGRSILEVDTGGLAEERKAGYLEVMRTGEPLRSVGREYSPARGEVYLDFSAFKVGDGLGVIVEDVTERALADEALRRYSDELARSNRELEQFAYVASHDLQEPLRMVTSYLQLLEKRYGEALGEDAREFISYAVDGAVRMRRMIEGLLAYSRVGTRGEPFRTVSCERVLGKVMDDLALAVKENEAEVTWEGLPELPADETQLAQVFSNLILNSVKFRGEEPPRVHVSARRSGAEWIFAVRDNGIGIDPEYHDRVFHIFERLHVGTCYPGTGIGLALARKVVERHGGRMWLESERGKGATFYFTLPAERS